VTYKHKNIQTYIPYRTVNAVALHWNKNTVNVISGNNGRLLKKK